MTTLPTPFKRLKKILSVIFFLIILYVVPLSGKPELLLNWQVIFLAIICSILIATQPTLSISESKLNKNTDRCTIWLIIYVTVIGQVTSIIEWAYFYNRTIKTSIIPITETAGNILTFDLEFSDNFEKLKYSFSVWIISGVLLLIVGTLLRLYAIKVLGKYFSAVVEIKDQHQIIRTGPFKVLRHPSYTGAYIAMLGGALFLHSLTGVIILGIGMLIVYHLRIKAEEKTLIRHFRKDYLDYANETWKMFPYIW